MVSASGALLGTPPCSPRAPRGVASYSATSGLPQPCPALLPARSLAALGGARGCPVSLLGRGRCSPAWGQLGLGRHWGGEQPGVRVGGWGLLSWLGTARGRVCAGTERFGCCCHCCGTHGTASCPHWCSCSQHWWGRVWGGGGSPRPGGTPWVLVPMVRPCRARGQGLQGGCWAAGRAAATSGS